MMLTVLLVAIGMLILFVLSLPMVGGIPTPQDARLLLENTTTKTANYDTAAYDMGAGFAPGGLGLAAAAVIDVTAADRANSDETYAFKLQESDTGSSGWTDIGVAASVPVAGAAATLGAVLARGFVNKRYVRLALTVGGTTPSVTFRAYLNTVIQR